MSGIVYGGLEIHKRSISACLLCPDTGEVVIEEVANDHGKVLKAVRRWQARLGELRLCCEASGAGFVLKRWLDEVGVRCEVIAPSLIPKAPGDRVKTDRRDTHKLASLYDRGSSRRTRYHAVATRAYQADTSSSIFAPVSPALAPVRNWPGPGPPVGHSTDGTLRARNNTAAVLHHPWVYTPIHIRG